MTDLSPQLREIAHERAADPFYQLLFHLGQAAMLLLAANRPMEDRRQLMMICESLGDALWPPIRREQLGLGPLKLEVQQLIDRRMVASSLSESDRIARIAEIEVELRELCERNSINLDGPLTPEMQERVQQVQTEERRAIEPLELHFESLRRRQQDLIDSLLKHTLENPETFPDQMRQVIKQIDDTIDAMTKIRYLGPDAVAPSGEPE